MISRFYVVFLLFNLAMEYAMAQNGVIQTPDEFLHYKLGSRFTPHHLLVDYFQYVDGISDKMQLVEYGETYELRPLIAAIISSPANMKRIESIRQNNLRRTGTLSGLAINEDITFVYLSYTVHGNEAAGAESSMAVLYDLIKGGAPYDSWLENTVVIIDPALNPDGYNRFSQWSNSVSSLPNNPKQNAREHSEPWPGGRSNHYYFDLNRDWAWQTQQESRDRVAFYLQWMPHVHADLHEMDAESPYYFAPAAQPYHPNVTQWQSDFQIEIGKNHASHFDKEGWRYYTREKFDLFYPSYGDTYPTFAGAIGMTYEQGGGGSANRAILLKNGDTLTLADRIAHHKVASLSTIEVSSKNAARLVKEFGSYFKKAIADPPGPINSYLIKASNQPGRIADFLLLLKRQGIIYGVLSEDHSGIRGLSYLTGDQDVFSAHKGDLVIPASQPRAVLVHVLFEPQAELTDSLTYDITAWCLPMAYGLEAYATEVILEYTAPQVVKSSNFSGDEKPYAYALQWGSVSATKALAALLAQGILARYATSPFRLDGVDYPIGTVLIMREDNRKHPRFDQLVSEIAGTSLASFSLIRSGFVETGKDMGSSDYSLVRRPEVLVLSGEGVSSLNLGEIWHFFEEELDYPVDLVNLDDVDNIALEAYNVVVLPEGYYSLEADMIVKISSWVSSGGRLVVMGSGIQKLAGKEGFGIASKDPVEPDSVKQDDIVHTPDAYNSGGRRLLSEDIPGTIFQTTMDRTNPLTAGLGEVYWSLKTSTADFKWLKEGNNAIYLDDTPKYYGFAGYKALEKTKKTLVAGQERKDMGSVVYMVDNPLFRAFWNSGKVLFSNALFF